MRPARPVHPLPTTWRRRGGCRVCEVGLVEKMRSAAGRKGHRWLRNLKVSSWPCWNRPIFPRALQRMFTHWPVRNPLPRDLQTSKNKISIGGLLDMPIYKGGIPPNVCNKLQSQIDAMTLLILDDVALAQRPWGVQVILLAGLELGGVGTDLYFPELCKECSHIGRYEIHYPEAFKRQKQNQHRRMTCYAHL